MAAHDARVTGRPGDDTAVDTPDATAVDLQYGPRPVAATQAGDPLHPGVRR